MGYTDTTYYKMKKPDASNKFDVADLNNALDTTDTVLHDNLTAQDQAIADNNAAQLELLNANDQENKNLISALDTRVTANTNTLNAREIKVVSGSTGVSSGAYRASASVGSHSKMWMGPCWVQYSNGEAARCMIMLTGSSVLAISDDPRSGFSYSGSLIYTVYYID